MKKAIALISMCCLLFTSFITVDAAKITKMGITKRELDEVIKVISENMVFDVMTSEELGLYRNYFEGVEFQHVSEILTSVKENGDTANLQSYQSIYCNADSTSTKDTVVFADMKVNYGEYNLMYLIEFHIDNDGYIYGHNIWVY